MTPHSPAHSPLSLPLPHSAAASSPAHEIPTPAHEIQAAKRAESEAKRAVERLARSHRTANCAKVCDWV